MIETTATTDEERLMPDPQPEGAPAIPPAPATAKKAPAKKAPAKKAPAKKAPAKKAPAKKAAAQKVPAKKVPAKKAAPAKAPADAARETAAQAKATVQEAASPVVSRSEPAGNGYRLPVSLGLAAAGLVALVISRIRRE